MVHLLPSPPYANYSGGGTSCLIRFFSMGPLAPNFVHLPIMLYCNDMPHTVIKRHAACTAVSNFKCADVADRNGGRDSAAAVDSSSPYRTILLGFVICIETRNQRVTSSPHRSIHLFHNYETEINVTWYFRLQLFYVTLYYIPARCSPEVNFYCHENPREFIIVSSHHV